MSTNHNRIKVADLETNQPNKILKTNVKGELEFSDENTKIETYNALDATTEGKALDARQGKVLKDLIENKQVDLASDYETQINSAVTEDKKVVSRSKLFNWWSWIKNEAQIISGTWTFLNPIKAGSATSGDQLTTLDQVRGLSTLNEVVKNGNIVTDKDIIFNSSEANASYGKNGFYSSYANGRTINANTSSFGVSDNSGSVKLETDCIQLAKIIDGNISRESLMFPFKSGTLATLDDISRISAPDATATTKGSIKLTGDLEGNADLPKVKGLEDKLTASLATDAETKITSPLTEDNKVVSRLKLFNWWEWIKSQTQTISGAWNFTNNVKFTKITTSSLIIPNDNLTATPQNGSIERDTSGRLWTTRDNNRFMLTEDDNSYIKIILNGSQKIIDTASPYLSVNNTIDTLLGSLKIGDLSNQFLGRLTVLAWADDTVSGGGSAAPESNKFQIVIKFNNALLSPNHYGEGYISELVLIEDANKTQTSVTLTASETGWNSNLGMFNDLYVYDKINKSTMKNLADVSAQIFCRRSIQFKDSTNANGNNQAIRNYTKITNTLIERIRR